VPEAVARAPEAPLKYSEASTDDFDSRRDDARRDDSVAAVTEPLQSLPAPSFTAPPRIEHESMQAPPAPDEDADRERPVSGPSSDRQAG
jgi:hypothetical protein